MTTKQEPYCCVETIFTICGFYFLPDWLGLLHYWSKMCTRGRQKPVYGTIFEFVKMVTFFFHRILHLEFSCYQQLLDYLLWCDNRELRCMLVSWMKLYKPKSITVLQHFYPGLYLKENLCRLFVKLDILEISWQVFFLM